METDVTPFTDMTEDQFFVFCQRTHDVRIERSAEGEILIMPPTGAATGNRNAKLTMQLCLWAEQNGTGLAFDSSRRILFAQYGHLYHRMPRGSCGGVTIN